jgi:alpha-tubulin suppressor-like RCC1 family protein
MATIVNLGKLRLDWRGDYSTATPYVANDVVTYRSQQWVCTQPTTAASFTASQTGTTLTVTSINPVATNVPIINTAGGSGSSTVVTVASTQGLATGNMFTVSGNAGGGLTAGVYYVGSVLSSTTLTLSSSYANAIAGTYITFTGFTFGSVSSGTPYNTGTSFTATGTLAVGQVVAGTGSNISVIGASGNGTTVTLNFAAQSSAPFQTGTYITVSGCTPNAYNGTWFVTASTISTVSFASNITQGLQVSGQIVQTLPTTITALGTGSGGLGTYILSTSGTQVAATVTTLNTSIPSTTSSFWTPFTSLFNNQGTWAANTSYNVGDVVVFATPTTLQNFPATVGANYSINAPVTQSYYCTLAHTSTTNLNPANLTYWTPVNRRGIASTSAGATTGTVQLGVYSNQNYQALVLPNRGIAYDTTLQYYNGATKNTTDSTALGYVTMNGQAVSWNQDVNGSVGMSGSGLHGYAMNTLTFPFYDFWRSTSNSGGGIHATPDGGVPRVIQWEKAYDRNLVLMNSGEVFAWGYGGNGELGNGGTSSSSYPVRVGGPLAAVYGNTSPTTGVYNQYTAGHAFWNVRIKRISTNGGCGYAAAGGTSASSSAAPGHCLAIDENGQLWAWGNNAYGQLGIGALNSNLNTTNSAWPQPIPTLAFATPAAPTGQKVVACWACGTGYAWSYAVTADGNLWVWGYNGSGQLGNGNNNTLFVPTLISNVAGTGQAFGASTIGNIVKIQVLDNASATTYACAAILTSTGLMFVTGNNASGWMGFATTPLNTWTNIAGGPGSTSSSTAKDFWLYGSGGIYGSCMVRDSVTGYCWTAGYNSNGQLGYAGTSTSSSNVFGISKINVAGQTYNLVNVKQLAFTAFNTVCSATVVLDNGVTFSIGHNQVGQTSVGFSGTNVNANADANAVENINSYIWQMVRAAPGMQGSIADVMGFGWYNGSAYLMWLMWKNADGRIMIAGTGQNGAAGQGNALGQYIAEQDNVHAESMGTPLVD